VIARRPGPALTALLLTAALSLPSLAHALSWWVADTAEAVELQDALDTWWPDHDIAVRVGTPTWQRDAIWYAGGELVMVAGERVRWQATEADWPTQVALVRSWLRDRRRPDAGWIPRAKQTLTGYGAVSLGGGLRLPSVAPDLALAPASPAGQATLAGGIAWRFLRVGAFGAFGFGESAGQGVQAVSVTRLFVGGTASLVAPLGALEMENVLGFGARVVVLQPKELDVEPSTVRLASFLLGLRLLGRPRPLVGVGGGVSIGIDAAPIFVQVGDDATPELLSPVTFHAELVVVLGGATQGEGR
jgi:hypothetical protein